MNIWEETVLVRFGDIDCSDRLTIAAACGYFQEAAIHHVEQLGFGRDTLLQSRQAWVLSRLSVFMERRPRYRERITVRSWPQGEQKLFAIRNYEIRNEHGEGMVWGKSAWLILDVDKRIPLRARTIVAHLPDNSGLDSLSDGAQALKAYNPLTKVSERHAQYSDIDYNGHVNNVRYIQWIADCTEPSLLEHAEQIRIDINYMHEIKKKECVSILSGAIDDHRCAYEGHRDGHVMFRAELGTFEKGQTST
ncbi:MAG: acyl-ACP thioesterase [Treponema sp.]|jgi:acyl-ACP thioesterase|nr:acyl-ACP thioesterase [Treponema sp.]